MKKIMFNDRYGLTRAVLDGRKTQTRRVVPQSVIDKYEMMEYPTIIDDARYEVGEVVAVAQSYIDCGNLPDYELDEEGFPIMPTKSGYFNKMFVRADLMPHHIRITDVRIERLQDISDEDCVKEGIIKKWHALACKNYYYVPGCEIKSFEDVYDTAKEAFAHLIDKVSGKGTWERNPYVFVYDFEFVKNSMK